MYRVPQNSGFYSEYMVTLIVVTVNNLAPVTCISTFCLTNADTLTEEIQWNLCIMHGHLHTRNKCPNYQGVLIFQVIYIKSTIWDLNYKCVDYAGVLIFECPH